MTPTELHMTLVQVRRLRTGFAHTAPQPWTASTAAAELSVQMGHLAHCLLHRSGTDTTDLDDPDRPITDPGDELADVLLAALSVPVLAGTEPTALDPVRPTGDEAELFLRLLVAAGRLAEAAMVHDGLRHHPTGEPPSIAVASAAATMACGALADQLGLDLMDAFGAMVQDADTFLNAQGAGS